MSESTITYKVKIHWYAYPSYFLLSIFGSDKPVRDWMYKVEGAK